MLSSVQQFSLVEKREERKMRFVKKAAYAAAFAVCVAAVVSPYADAAAAYAVQHGIDVRAVDVRNLNLLDK